MKVFIVIDQTQIPRDSIVDIYKSYDLIPNDIKNNPEYIIKEKEVTEKKQEEDINTIELNSEIETMSERKLEITYGANYFIFYEGKITIKGKKYKEGVYNSVKVLANELLEFNKINNNDETLILVTDYENDYTYIVGLTSDVDANLEKFKEYLKEKEIYLE